MKELLQKIINNTHTKDKLFRNRLLLLNIGCLLIAAMFWAYLPVSKASADSGLKIYDYNTKQTINYTGKKVKVNLNGDQISKDETPGIIIDGIALLSYKDIFAKSPIKADCVYNKPEGTVTISKFGTTIVLKINSKTALVNGKTVTMPVAPIKIKYVDAKVTKILVPSRFVAETLGYKYTWYSSRDTVEMEGDPLSLTINDGNKFAYFGTKADVTIDGKKVNPGKMPGIIIDNITMLRAKRVFADSAIKAKYKYDSSSKTVTLTKDGKKLVMTIGETTAYLNGNPIKMDIAPMLVTNHDNGTTYVMVPGSFTASCLGYDYMWNKAEKTSVIRTREEVVEEETDDSEQSENNNEDKNPDSSNEGSSGPDQDNAAPELGDEGVITDPGTVIRQWSSDNNVIGISNNVHEINGPSNTTEPLGSISTNFNSVSTGKINMETFQFSSNAPYGRISSSFSNQTITLRIPNMSCSKQTYQVNGYMSSLVNSISTSYDSKNEMAIIELRVLSKDITYDISLSNDRMSLFVNIYANSLKSAVVGTNHTGDYLTLTGIRPMEVTVTNQGGILLLELPYTVNGLGDQYLPTNNAKFMEQIFFTSPVYRTQIYIEIKEGTQYYIAENGNHFTIVFHSSGTIIEPEIPVEPSKPTKPGDIDPSNYEIKIPIPSGIDRSDVDDEDYYLKKQFVILIDGDHRNYYKSKQVSVNSNVVSDVSVSLNKSYQTEIRFTTTKLQGYEYVMDDSYIYVHIDKPRNIYKNIVVLDPGHGGPARGAYYFNTNEKDLNFKMLYTIGKKYFNSDTSNIKAYYTRTSDVDVDLYDRAAFAKEVGADLFVSLHMNASTSSSAQGTEVYYSESNNSYNKAGLNSKILATTLVNNLSEVMGTKNRGINSAKFVVVYRNTVPAVLVELGFMSNREDFNKISNEKYQEQAMKTIYETLCDIFNKYPTGR